MNQPHIPHWLFRISLSLKLRSSAPAMHALFSVSGARAGHRAVVFNPFKRYSRTNRMSIALCPSSAQAPWTWCSSTMDTELLLMTKTTMWKSLLISAVQDACRTTLFCLRFWARAGTAELMSMPDSCDLVADSSLGLHTAQTDKMQEPHFALIPSASTTRTY